MRKISFIAILILLTSLCGRSQVSYSTTASGDWNDPTVWDVGVPPNILSSLDSIFVHHAINFNVNQVVLGYMEVVSGASLVAQGKINLKVGKGDIDQGVLVNRGVLQCNDLEVKPDNGCVTSNDKPIVHNYGSITTDDDLHVGNNCGRGAFINHIGGKVYVTDQLHLDHYICNRDTMYIYTVFKVHGGTVDCCGYFETPLIDIDANGSRPSDLICSDICDGGGLDPTIDIGGSVYLDLNTAYNTAPQSETLIDDDSLFICGLNQGGGLNSLPIQLISFRAKRVNDQVLLNWRVASEVDLSHYVIQKSVDGNVFVDMADIQTELHSKEGASYVFVDSDLNTGHIYYRLKWVDLDGTIHFSNVIVVVEKYIEYQKAVYPNPTMDLLQYRQNGRRSLNLQIRDAMGLDVTHLCGFTNENTSTVSVDVSSLIPGLYVLHDGMQHYRFIVKR